MAEETPQPIHTPASVAESESAHERRLEEAFTALSRDVLEPTYESKGIRELEHRIAVFQAPGALDVTGLSPQEIESRLEELQATLAALRAQQKDEDLGKLSAKQPKIPVRIVKPNPTQKSRLSMLEQKIIAERAQAVFVEEGPLLREALVESAKTSITMAGLYDTEDEVREQVHRMFGQTLIELEGRTDAHAEQVQPNDPELEFSEEERAEFEVNVGLEGAEAAEAFVLKEQRRRELLAEKMNKLVAARKEQFAERRKEILELTDAEILDKIIFIQTLHLALELARAEVLDYWLLFCVQDPLKGHKEKVRGEWLTVGYEPFFSTVEEVRATKRANEDFWTWLVEQRNRLDYLTEEDLYALAAYTPFRETVDPMLRLRRGAPALAALRGS